MRSKKALLLSKGSLFRHQRDDLTCKRADFRKIVVGLFSQGTRDASTSSADPNRAHRFLDNLGHFAPIGSRNSWIVGSKAQKKAGVRGQFVTLMAKKAQNRWILVRFLARAEKVRDSGAKTRPSQS